MRRLVPIVGTLACIGLAPHAQAADAYPEPVVKVSVRGPAGAQLPKAGVKAQWIIAVPGKLAELGHVPCRLARLVRPSDRVELVGADDAKAHQRCARASFAPSATNAPAKVRRIHAIARGLVMTCCRTHAANMP